MLDTENIERKRLGAHGHNTIFADDAVLLAATDKFACQKQQRTLAAVDQHELIHGSACVVLRYGNGTDVATMAHNAHRATLADDYFAAG